MPNPCPDCTANGALGCPRHAPKHMEASIAEAVAKLTEERDALAAAIDGSKNCPKCHGFGYVDDGKSRTYYETDTAAEADLTDMWHRVKCSCRKVDTAAILVVRDARIRAEGRKAGLLHLAKSCRGMRGCTAGSVIDLIAELAAKAGEGSNAD